MTNAFNKKIRLLALEPAPGLSEPEIIDSAEVWADVSDVGTVTKLEAMAAGINAELTAVMWRREFRDFTHAEYGGVHLYVRRGNRHGRAVSACHALSP